MRTLGIWLAILLLSIGIAILPESLGIRPFWPALVAILAIFATRSAPAGLGAGVIAGTIVASEGQLLNALRSLFSDHLFPQLSEQWHIGALVFTLLLGAFAGILESSGGFSSLLERMLRSTKQPRKRVLHSVYGLGLLCFFDGLANSMLTGRIARPAVDRTGISREKLAWVVDSTSSPVACIAFISTWIATQLTYILQALPEADAYTLYFRSIPGNPYCVLTLLLVPLAIQLSWEPKWMRRYPARTPEKERHTHTHTPAWRVIVPLIILALSIAAGFQIWSGEPINWFSLDTWRTAAGGNAGPTALVAGAIAGLIAAGLCHPKTGPGVVAKAALKGASGLLPALVVLIFAWCLGSVFRSLEAAEALQKLLGDSVSYAWLPLAVFGVASLTAFITGSSWGTMGLLMPLALGVLTESCPPELTMTTAPAVIGAVFGGAVFGDHASPFSDTTIVSAIAAGCKPIDHVLSQLPYALTVAIIAGISYLLMARGLAPVAATGIGALLLTASVMLLRKRAT